MAVTTNLQGEHPAYHLHLLLEPTGMPPPVDHRVETFRIMR
jgi:hypothetical protein